MGDGGKGSSPRPFSVSQETFGNNFDKIFGKKSTNVLPEVLDAYNDERLVSKFDKEQAMQVRVKENPEEVGKCGCGRSLTGKCVGWHSLSEEDYADRKEKYETGKVDLSGKDL